MLKRLRAAIGRLMPIHFAPDNHVRPVFRFGLYNRVRGPGFVWIIPVIEEARPVVKTSIYVGKFLFEDVMSRDNIPFRVQMTVLAGFDPDAALKRAAAVLVRAGESLIVDIIKDYTNQGLRRQWARFDGEELNGGNPMTTIEQNLTRSLTAELRPLGIAPLPNGGILIREAVPPEKFKRGVLNARRLEAMLQALTRYPVPELIGQAIRAGFMTGLEDLPSELTLLSTLSPLEQVYPFYPADIQRASAQNGHNGRGRH